MVKNMTVEKAKILLERIDTQKEQGKITQKEHDRKSASVLYALKSSKKSCDPDKRIIGKKYKV